MEIYDIMISRIDVDTKFSYNIVFSAETTFQLAGRWSRKKLKYTVIIIITRAMKILIGGLKIFDDVWFWKKKYLTTGYFRSLLDYNYP